MCGDGGGGGGDGDLVIDGGGDWCWCDGGGGVMVVMAVVAMAVVMVINGDVMVFMVMWWCRWWCGIDGDGDDGGDVIDDVVVMVVVIDGDVMVLMMMWCWCDGDLWWCGGDVDDLMWWCDKVPSQGCANSPKMQEQPQNSRRSKGELKAVEGSSLIRIRRHYTPASEIQSPGRPGTRTCLPQETLQCRRA